MNFYILLPIIALLTSGICSFLLIPQILRFCKEKGLYDLPNARKVHKTAIPRLGGICFLPSMLLSFFIALAVFDGISGENHITISLWTLAFVVSMLLIYGVGIMDDLLGLNAKVKFLVQIAAACLMPMAGLCINNLYGLFGIEDIPFWIGAPLTVFIMVFIMNAINLIDGIDGLCAGLSFLALGGFLISFIREDMLIYSILIAGVMGVLIPYFYYNVYGDPDKGQKIFMGDSGSLTLGFILAFLFVKYAMNNPNVMPFRLNGLLLPCTLLVVPVFDVVRIILVRMRHKRPLFDADKNHIHHKLMRAGLSQHQALICILLLALGFICLNLTLFLSTNTTTIIVVDIVAYTTFHWTLDKVITAHGEKAFQKESL